MDKVKLTINNKKITASANDTIIEAASKVGINIPTLCYLKNLNNIGSCKMCVVEVDGQPNLITSCNNKVTEGMIIHTNSDRVKRARKEMLNLILADHDYNCSKCKSNHACELQNLAEKYKIKKSTYKQDCLETPIVENNPFLEYDSSKCINCKRCVSACKKISRNGILTTKKLGPHAFINTPFGEY